MPLSIEVAARSSLLSRAQVDEVLQEIRAHHPQLSFQTHWVETQGDRDLATSLRFLDKTDFFTREVDTLVRARQCRLSIHSAKDLPGQLPEGLHLIALTRGLDSRDALVLREGETLSHLPQGARIGTSSVRREKAIHALCADFLCTDVRGTIEKRLALLDNGALDGLIVAEAALLRLGLQRRNRVMLPGESAPLQGRLAILAREEDEEMKRLFAPIDTRALVLYLGTHPEHFFLQRTHRLVHYPVIALTARPKEDAGITQVHRDFARYTHILFTSKNGVRFFCQAFPYDLEKKTLIAIGHITAHELAKHRRPADYVAEQETAEGLIALLETLPLSEAYVLLPRSCLSRAILPVFFQERGVRYYAFDLYDTKLQRPGPLPDLSTIDEIVFTSPSTVRGFLALYGSLPRDKILRAQGPITQQAIAKAYTETA